MQIQWDDLGEVAATVREEIEARLESLIGQHDDVLSVRIAGRGSRHHKHGGREVHITARAKGREIVASRGAPDLAGALHDALDAFARELRKLRAKHSPRQPQRAGGPAFLGLVDRLNREEGYGFALTDDGTSVYFHRNAVSGGLAFESLEVGQRIALSIEAGAQGPQATVIAPAGPDAPSP